MVEVIICPQVSLPKDIGYKRKLSDNNVDKNNNNNTNNTYKNINKVNKTLTQKELRLLHNEIKEFSASSLTGSAKNRYKNDILTKLGAPPPKQMKMPLPMKLKLLQRRKENALQESQILKESGVVTSTHKNNKKMNSNKNKTKSNSHHTSNKPSSSNGVLRVDPSKFVKKYKR